MLELYAIDLSPFTRPVQLQLEIKGADFTRITPDRDMILGEAYGRLTPMRKVPLLVVDGTPIWESAAIMELVEEMYPTPTLLPGDPVARAKARMLAALSSNYLAMTAAMIFSNRRDGGGQAIEDHAKALMARGLNALEETLTDGPYALGTERSIADVMLPPALLFIGDMMGPLGFAGIPELGERTQSYRQSVREDADIDRCLTEMETCFAAMTAG